MINWVNLRGKLGDFNLHKTTLNLYTKCQKCVRNIYTKQLLNLNNLWDILLMYLKKKRGYINKKQFLGYKGRDWSYE